MSNANQARATIASGDALDVRSFSVAQAISALFRVEVTVVSRNLDIDFDDVLGEQASFSLGNLLSNQSWSGVCIEMDQIRVERDGLATYQLVLAPRAWLLTQRKNYRIFQYKSELQIVTQLLSEWGVPMRVQCSPTHKPRKFRAQYAESDFDFVARMLEDAGISFWFNDVDGETVMVLDDDPQAGRITHAALRFHDQPGVTDASFATKVTVAQRIRPGAMTVGDLDYRRGSTQQPRLSQAAGLAVERPLEQFDYEPGAFLYEASGGGSTPTADDRGTARTDETVGKQKTFNRLQGARQDGKQVSFESDVLTLAPGAILSIVDHPHVSLGEAGLLVTRATIAGKHSDDWRVKVDSAPTEVPFRPARITPKPRVHGLESATVVGPSSEEIHTDEYARVRVHFHWDRESARDESSSCWVPTNQPWAGAGFGGTVLPRIGQEVFVEFLGGDPDRPVVIGRTFTEHCPAPYPLPMGKTMTALIGKATPALVSGGASGYDGEVFMYQRGGPSKAFNADFPGPMRIQKYSDTSNMVLIEDKEGKNLLFLQAQRDLNMLVKNSWRTVVGNYRGCVVLGNDDLHVGNKQLISVVEAQRLAVAKEQTIRVGKKRVERVDEDLGLIVKHNAKIKCKATISHKAKKSIVIEAGELIRLRVGDSVVLIDAETIVIESPNVDINP